MCSSHEGRLPSGQRVGPCRSSYETCGRNARRGDSYRLVILHNAERPTPLQHQHPAWLQDLVDQSAEQLTQAILYRFAVRGTNLLTLRGDHSKRVALGYNGKVRVTHPKKQNPGRSVAGVFLLKPGDDLLSHGETPHYHRRCTVSLLSSEWIRWFQYSIVARQTGVNGK